jgi:ABC-type transport system substrate-binding protein
LLRDLDVQKNRSEAREIMQKLGYGPDKRLAIKVSTRDIPPYRDPAVILTDQLKEVLIDGDFEIVETASWFPKVMRKDYKIGLNLTGGGSTTPTSNFTRTTAAVPNGITPAIAIPSSKSCSTGNQWKPTKESAISWCGRLKGSWLRTVPGRSSFTTASRTAGSRS